MSQLKERKDIDMFKDIDPSSGVVAEVFDDRNWRRNQAKIKWGILRDKHEFWERRGLNPYKIINFYECFDNPSANPIFKD